MLDLKECTYKLYGSVFDALAPMTQRKIKAAYDSRPSYVEQMSVLVYAAHSVRAKKLTTSMDSAIFHIERQARELGAIGSDMMVEAIKVVERFNRMNSEYIRYKRDHSDERMPYVTFEPCCWYMEALRLLTVLHMDEYPLVNNWQEFFLFLPLSGAYDEARGGTTLTMVDYMYAVKDGKFEKWYQKANGYGSRLSQFTRGGFKEMYADEMISMTAEELQVEYDKQNWGHQIVKAEVERRRGRG